MRRQSTLQILLLATLILGVSSLAHAQANRTWVSEVSGDDVNPCSRTAPCKTFAGAIAKTNADGEISVIDAGGYGSVTITKAITINGEGTLASVMNPTVNGIIVNATATSIVILRNLSIVGVSTGMSGIRILAARTVQVDHCWINGQESHGIEVAATANINLIVNDTIINDCSLDGIHVNTTAGQALLSVENSRIQNCDSDGIQAVDNVRASITNSVLTHNAATAIKTTGTNSQLNIDHVVASYSNVGLQASAGSNIRVSDSVISQNATGVNANGGTMDSFQGNSLIGNTVPGVFTTTTLKQ